MNKKNIESTVSRRLPLSALYLLSIIVGLLICIPTYSQYSDETFSLKQTSEQFDERGFQKGQIINVDGKLAVSNVNGAVSYGYPLDRFTQRGYSFSVDLNYCSSVAFSSFKAYNHGTASGSGSGLETPDYWDKFTRNHPLWIVGVNGFAVQTLSLVSDYRPPTNFNTPVWDASDVPWLVEGYDFCNRMNRIENTGQYDVISLLRADGSLLELRNPYKWNTEGGTVAPHKFVTGDYFEDATNTAGFAIVKFDTVRIMSDMYNLVRQYIDGSLGQGNPEQWKNQLYQYLPRRVSYYPGDGLEYVFVEHQVPYGWPRYDGDDPAISGGKTAGPTIFYLKEINDASGVVMELKYSRHETPGDGTPGRALVKEIGDYVKFNYGDQFIAIQAHGRTTSLQLQKPIPLSLFDEQTGGNFGSKDSYIGLVKTLRDPENRLTEFAYEDYKRIFKSYKHPYTNVDELEITSSRLTSIKEPAARYAIAYHEGTLGEREIVYTPNAAPTGALADWRLNNAAKSVTKYNNRNQWLTTETYCFDGLSTSDPQMCNNQVLGLPHTVYKLKDRKTQKEKLVTYTYQRMEVPRYRAQSAPHPLAQPLVYTALLGVQEEADGKVISTQTTYAVQSNGALILPTGTEQYVRQSNSPAAIRTSLVKMNYVTRAGHGYNGPLPVSGKHMLKIEKKTEAVYDPKNGTDILMQNVTEYLQLPYLATTQQVAQVWWDKLASLARYDSLYKAGILSCYWEDMPDSLHVYDTLGVREFSAPPFYGLVKERYQLDAQNRYLGGTKTVYEQTSVAPGSNRRGLPLRDSLIAEDKASAVLIGENIYGANINNNGGYGWVYSDERLPVRRRDGNGAIIEQAYRFASRGIPSGLRINDDGTTKNEELRDRLLGLGLEKPLIDKKLIRNPRTGMIDTLKSRNEWTFYGLLSGHSDYNGYYSRFEYDKNGRLSTAQLPKDFLGTQNTCTERVNGLVEYKSPTVWTDYHINKKKVTCPGDNYVAEWMEYSKNYMVLTAGRTYYNGPCPLLYLTSTGITAPYTGEEIQTQGKRGREEVLVTSGTLTFETYTKQQTDVAVSHFDVKGQDNLFDVAQVLRSGSFNFFISSMQGRCFTMEIIVRRIADNKKMATRRYVMNCQSGGAIGGGSISAISADGNGKKESILADAPENSYMFSVPFKAEELQEFSQSGTDGFDVEIHVTTPGARINLVADAEDKRPHWKLDGVFDLPTEQKQFTISYQYSTKTDDAVIQRVKTDDRYTSVNYPNAECRPVRYREIRHEFGADQLVEKTKISIGDPTLPIRVDSVLTDYTGRGQARKATDQEGFIIHTEYDAWGRPVKVINADSTYTTYTYEFGNPMNLSWQTQDYYGYYEAVISTTYDKDNLQRYVSYKYTDALGRLRREQAGDVGFGKTTYEYDNRNRLVAVINPSGDETQYWYDEYNRMKYKYQPDMGYTSYAYDAMGNVRFTQTQKQSDDGQLAFMQYDDLGRVTLVGEARLNGQSGGGGHGGIGITGGGGKKEQTLSVLPPAPRLTDELDGTILHDGGQSSAVTANKTVWLGALSPLPQFWTINQLSQTECIPQPIIGPVASPFMVHPVQNYNDPGLPLATENDFEDIARYPENARTAIHYDDLPATAGSVWLNFPTRAQWNALAPTGVVRNLKGKQSAVAYRGQAGEPYHFVVMSYDERGRVEALLRYTENLGFDAVYYTYNTMNAITSIRAVDPLRQSAAWYSYDWNGRVDSVWTTLSVAGNGLGVVNPSYRSPETRPAQPDIVYSYSKRGTVNKMKYPQVATEVNYRYNARAFLDTLLAEKNGVLTFRQLLEYNSLSRITKQRSQHTGQSEVTAEYTYDYLGQLANVTETRNGIMTVNTYNYDEVGNRMFNIALGPQPGRNSYEYNDATGPNRLSTRRDSVYQNGVWTEAGYTSYSYNVNGALTNRTQTGIGNPITETFDYDNIQNVVKKYTRAQGASVDDWRYRYSASAAREQKRLYSTTQQPTREWRYYLLDIQKRQLAVYNGIETNQTSCGQVFGATPVYLSASEYLFYGGSTHNLTIKPTGLSTNRKEYKIQDMLGSTRVVIEPDGMGGGVITGKTDYDAWGRILMQSGQPQRLSFTDKEKDTESKLGDFGVRKYDDAIGRFTSIDPLWERHRWLTPYHYVLNNPLRLIDPTGMDSTSANNMPVLNAHGNVSIVEDMKNMTVTYKAYSGQSASLGASGRGSVSYTEKQFHDGSTSKSVSATDAVGRTASISLSDSEKKTTLGVSAGVTARSEDGVTGLSLTGGPTISQDKNTRDISVGISFTLEGTARTSQSGPIGGSGIIGTIAGIIGGSLTVAFDLTPSLPPVPYTATCIAPANPSVMTMTVSSGSTAPSFGGNGVTAPASMQTLP